MPLPPPVADRTALHTRNINVQAFERVDGLWDLDVHLVDVKPIDCPLESGVRPAGEPVHVMWMRLTIDTAYTIQAVSTVTDRMPYPGFCQSITPAYDQLVGMNLLKNFRLRVAEMFRGTAGCTHLTELLSVVPTAAVQSLFAKPSDADQKPFQLDRCHALDTRGEAVARYYPRWYVSDNRSG